MSDKIGWVDNLRAVACLMVVLIHSTTYYITAAGMPGERHWDVANLLNSACRVGGSVVLYDFRLPVFWRAAGGKKHMLRIGFCLLFYSAVALAYMALLTPIHAGNALRLFWQKPVFYHLWFFYAILVIYLLSPLIRVPPVSGRYLAVVVLILAVVANPNTPELTIGHTPLLPINVYIVGDTFYYLLYALVGRALGTLTPTRWVTLGAVPLFVVSVLLIAMGTSQQTLANDNFTQTFYLYANPLVFIAAVYLMILFKAAALSAPLPGFSFISRHSLAIYGFHALIIHFIRTRDLALKGWPILDVFYVFFCAVVCSMLLSLLVQRCDIRRWVS